MAKASTTVILHDVQTIRAADADGGQLLLVADDETRINIFFTDRNTSLVGRLADAINGAVTKPEEKR